MALDQKYYQWFRISITLLVALVYLSYRLKRYLLKDIYDFAVSYKDMIIGIYYIYIAYDIYINNSILSNKI